MSSGASPPHAAPAPTSWGGIARQLGPGLILSAVIVGSGELIVTPKLGASVGFEMLWFIVLGCVLKVFVQAEFGRHTLAHGLTPLKAFDSVPGPRWRVSWMLWLWLLMYLGLIFQVAGIVGGLAGVCALAGIPASTPAVAIVIGTATAALLVIGRYRFVERFSMILVAAFTVGTMFAVFSLQATPFAISPGQIVEGLRFHLPASFGTAFAAFGIIGVGGSELIYYPYWCLEKGYARNVGPNDGSAEWRGRARGWLRVMNVDVWVSFAIYTSATVAFYLLGAAVLHGKGLLVENEQMVGTLSHMYRETFGGWGMGVFLVGAFAVLYSTVFGATASNARLFADALSVFGVMRYAAAGDYSRMVRVGCVLLPLASTAVFLAFGTPVSLVLVGAIGQGLMLPFLGLAALHFRHRRTEPALRPGVAWTAGLWLSALSMGAVGLHQLVEQLRGLLGWR